MLALCRCGTLCGTCGSPIPLCLGRVEAKLSFGNQIPRFLEHGPVSLYRNCRLSDPRFPNAAGLQVTTAVLVPTSDSEDEGSGRRGSGIDFSNVSLRIKVEDVITGEVKLETRFPAQWMASVATFVPQLARPPAVKTLPLSFFWSRPRLSGSFPCVLVFPGV